MGTPQLRLQPEEGPIRELQPQWSRRLVKIVDSMDEEGNMAFACCTDPGMLSFPQNLETNITSASMCERFLEEA